MEGSIQQRLDKMSALSDEELEKIVQLGINIDIDTSEAAIAKRVLENRRQKRQVLAAEKVETVTNQLDKSHVELVKMVKGMGEIVILLHFFKMHWFPKSPLWVKIVNFIFFTVIFGIIINIAADYITKFWLKW